MGSRDSWIDPDEVSELAEEIAPAKKGPIAEGDGDGEESYVPQSLIDEDEEENEVESAGESIDGDLPEPVRVEEPAVDLEGEPNPVERISEHLKEIRVRAERSGLLIGKDSPEESETTLDGIPEPSGEEEKAQTRRTEIEIGIVPEPFKPPDGRLVERLGAFAEWLSQDACGFEQAFVLDELGDELIRGQIPPGLRSGAVRLAQSWERSQHWLREEGQAACAPVAAAMLADGKVLSVVGTRCSSGFYCAAMVGPTMVGESFATIIRSALGDLFG